MRDKASLLCAFSTGVLLTCGLYELHSSPVVSPRADDITTLPANPTQQDNIELSQTERVIEQGFLQGEHVSTHGSAPDETLLALNQRLKEDNAKLQAQLSALQSDPSGSTPTFNVASRLAAIFAQQRRDEVWASEVELFAEDFLYEVQLHDDITLLASQCKQHVCQLNFTSESHAGAANWQQLHTALLRMPWMKQFKTVTAVQNKGTLQIHLSLKTSDELRSEY
ncbi:hypothetical protein JF50_25775 [Pseudoalteromonas luteoviolacea]|uniref:Uncharacterized protein n=1 Tax=Pseudoalteromonas luteoviolacea TaxID=43657 RepID=A0A0C1QJD9_9GAMM|nr:hypothetical protein [Pseudoalteromonas luteoviolacea]KID55202.1 hypothetical protein JF50_25775 [Pseudoalteromonas luteoviolacea]